MTGNRAKCGLMRGGEPCGVFTPGMSYDPTTDCRKCWRAHHPKELPAPREAKREPGKVAARTTVAPLRFLLKVRKATPCAFRGAETGRQLRCATCGPERHTPEYACSVHGVCTADRRAYIPATDASPQRVTTCCLYCPEYATEPPAPPMVRHLLYYVWPVGTHGVWQLNLDRLKARIALFDGRKVVAVASGGADLGAVRDYLGDAGTEFLTVPNDPALREVVAWEPLWERVQGLPGATFFAHAKGVTKPLNDGVTVHPWTAAMYEANLDYWPVVADVLKAHPVAGCFKKVGRGFLGGRSAWHYSGTFYWVRNDDFFARDWRGIERTWWGTESYPGVAYSVAEGGVVFGSGRVRSMNLYGMKSWQRTAREYEKWKASHAGKRATPPSAIGSAT